MFSIGLLYLITYQVLALKLERRKKLKNSFGSEYLLDPEDFTNVIEKSLS